jgi:hypothetical protein
MTFRAWVNELLVPALMDRWFVTLVFVVVLILFLVALYDIVVGVFIGRTLAIELAPALVGIVSIALAVFSGSFFLVEEAKLGWALTLGDGANAFETQQGVFHLFCLLAAGILLVLGIALIAMLSRADEPEASGAVTEGADVAA